MEYFKGEQKLSILTYRDACDNCEVCNVRFSDTIRKCIDHDHSSGEFRYILCNRCNSNDYWKRIQDGTGTIERPNKVIGMYDCTCGLSVRKDNINRHKRSQAHRGYTP